MEKKEPATYKGGVCIFFKNALENWVGPSTKTNL